MSGEGRAAIVPWHMWGDTKNVIVRSSGGLVTFGETQFARIGYGRPDTWSFLLSAQITDQSGQFSAGTALTVHYDLSPGIGRSSITIPDFHVFRFDYGGVRPVGGINPPGGQFLYTTTVANRVGAIGALSPGPAFDPGVNYVTTQWIDTFVAQDIQLRVRVGLDSAGEATTANVAVSAFFSPRTHVRPEWFEEVGRFPGDENRGT